MLNNLKTLLETKSFVVSLLACAAAAAAAFGYNVDPSKIVAVLSPIMVMIGATGWGENAAKHAADAEVAKHAMTLAAAKAAADNTQLVTKI